MKTRLFLAFNLGSILISTAARGPNNESLGYIYALARNASSDMFQFIDLDLTTWETGVSALPPEVRIAGEAAAFMGGIFWSFTMDQFGNRSIIGIDVSSKAIAYSVNASAWSPPLFIVSAIFPIHSNGGLLVIGVAPGNYPLRYCITSHNPWVEAAVTPRTSAMLHVPAVLIGNGTPWGRCCLRSMGKTPIMAHSQVL